MSHYKCNVCGLTYFKENEVVAHIKKIHGVKQLWEYVV